MTALIAVSIVMACAGGLLVTTRPSPAEATAQGRWARITRASRVTARPAGQTLIALGAVVAWTVLAGEVYGITV